MKTRTADENTKQINQKSYTLRHCVKLLGTGSTPKSIQSFCQFSNFETLPKYLLNLATIFFFFDLLPPRRVGVDSGSERDSCDSARVIPPSDADELSILVRILPEVDGLVRTTIAKELY